MIDHYALTQATPNPFKIGDKVVCVHPGNAGLLVKGGEYTVCGHTNRTHCVMLEGVKHGHFHSRFALAVQPEAPKLNPEAEARKAQYYADRQAAYDKWAEDRNSQGLTREGVFLAGWDACRAWDKAKWEARQAQRDAHKGCSRACDPQTSKDAAKATKVGKLHEQIIVSLRDFGTATAAELSVRIGAELNAVSPRMKRLVDQGWVTVIGTQVLPGQRARSVYAYNRQAEAYQQATNTTEQATAAA